MTITLNPGTGGPDVASDVHSGEHYQIIKAAGNPSPYWPAYDYPATSAPAAHAIDEGGALITRGAVLTDEGTFRCNFANSSLAVSIGTATLTNGSAAVTWAISPTTDLHIGDYIKLDADAESAWAQIASLDSATSGTLVSNYTGTGGTSAASRALLRPTTGAGASITVASGQCTIAAGTTAAAVTQLRRLVDYAPLVIRERLSVSQRIANQIIYINAGEDVAAPRWFARFAFDGTVNTTVKCQTGRNPTGAPSASEIEETVVTLPNGATSAQLVEYRIEILTETIRFYADGVLVAAHSRVIPAQHDVMTAGIVVVNGTTPASGTNVVIDYVTTKNHNKVEVGVLSDTEQIVAAQPAVAVRLYSVAGVIAINTDLMVIDCSQLRSLSIQCTSMGTAGVVTAAWSNDGVNWVTASLVSESGVVSTTFNAAVLRGTNVRARFFRLRMTTATTAGTTTIVVVGSQSDSFNMLQLATQPVSGTLTVNQGTMVALPAGTNAVGDVGVQYRANATGAATPANVLSPATPAVQTVKAAAGRLLSMVLTNTNVAARFLKVWNLASGSITLGTTAALFEIGIPPNQTIEFSLEGGLGFSTAINIAVTGGQGLTNNAAITLGDVTGVIAFA